MSEYSILFVDDEENILRVLKRIFRKEPYQFFFALGADAALAIVHEHPVDIIISDYRMPKMDGVELLKQIHELFPETIRIILTGLTDFSVAQEAVNKGHVYKFLSKPINPAELRTVIIHAVEQIKLERENKKLQKKINEQNALLKELNEELEQTFLQRNREFTLYDHALRTSQNIVEYLPFPIFGISEDRHVVLINKKGASLFEDTEGVIGSRIDKLFPTEFVQCFNEVLKTQELMSDQPFLFNGEHYCPYFVPVNLTKDQYGLIAIFVPVMKIQT